ncbi:MAG: hypothetical protein IT563_13460 [Alphaproteobacteria bacterium]|nr:hypothetical protein [Alphaproteobacteria bacterium]
MTSDDTASAAAWLAAYLDAALPPDQIGAAVASTRRASAVVGQRADALVMEDEPAGFVVALDRLQGKRS